MHRIRSLASATGLACLVALPAALPLPALAEAVIDPSPLWDFADPAASELRFSEAARLSTTPTERALWTTQQARARGLARDFDGGRRLLDALPQALLAAEPELHVRALLERGRLLNSAGSPARAVPAFVAAWQVARGAGLDGLAVDAAHMVGIAEPSEAGRAWTDRALQLAESSPDPTARRWRASLLNNLGWDHHEAGRFGEALSCFQRALDARREQGSPQSLHVARWAVARALRSLGRLEEALVIQRELRAASALGDPDPYVDEELAELLLATGRGAEAAPLFAEAHRGLASDPWLSRREPQRLERLARLGRGQESTADSQ